MGEIETCDVAVVGAGPAGSTAARALAAAGLETVLFEKHRLPRPKLCGGLLTRKTIQCLQASLPAVEDGLRAAGALLNVTGEYQLCYRTTRVSRSRSAQPFWFVRRDLYDAYLAGAAGEAGARLYVAEAVVHVDHDARQLTTATGRRWRYRYILGADGAASRVRRSLNLQPSVQAQWRDNLAVALEAAVDNAAVGRFAGRPVVFFGYVNQGYGWAFPHGERTLLGLGALPGGQGRPLRELWRAFLADLRVDPDSVAPAAHPVPYGYPLAAPGGRDCLLLGDAAGLVDPLYGEGIFFAHHSGLLAAQAVLEATRSGPPAPETYVSRLRPVFEEIRRRVRRRRQLFFVLNRFGPWPVKGFLAFGKGRLLRHIHGDYARYSGGS